MQRPPYALLHQHYPDPLNVPAEELWRWIGHPEKARIPGWQNTCAIRVSLALQGAGMLLPSGFLRVEAGKYKGRKLEIKQEALADFLTRSWGEPEKFSSAMLNWRVGQRRGVIRFLKLWGPYDPQGHIDLIAPDAWRRILCEGHCYLQSVECWFWECP